jgi:uncharacterized membrane protein YkvA (DUF1232 family)
MTSSRSSKQYSEVKFWEKLIGRAWAAGSEVVERALQLYYAAQDPETPAWARYVTVAALGYFISPLELFPISFRLRVILATFASWR